MNAKQAIQSQYHAGLAMLRQAVEKCPPALWDDPAYRNRTWNIAYHALFYVHFYLSASDKDFIPWARHRAEALEFYEGRDGQLKERYSPAEVLEYLDYVDDLVDGLVEALDLEGESGFYWLPFNKLELQFYNIRHLMLHTGELAERVWQAAGEEVSWVGMRPTKAG